MTKKCVKDYVEITIGKKTKKISIYNISNTPNYYYYFRHDGVKYQGSCGSNDLDTSKNKVREICYDLVKGVRQKGRKKKIKFDDIINDFLEYKKNQGKSPKTLVEYTRQSNYILEWYNEYSKGLDINGFFSTNKYENYCDWRRCYYYENEIIQYYTRKDDNNGDPIKGRTYKKVGNTSLNRECLLMGSILRYGKEHKGILKDVQIPSYQVKKEPSQINEKIILDDIKDYNNVKQYWMDKDQFLWDCFGTIFHLGLRPNELGKITFSCVHLKKGYVEIKNRKSKGKTINSVVPLDKTSRLTFERLMSRSGIRKGKNDLVFIREGMEKPYTSPYLSKLFKRSVKRITGKDMTLHSLRHLWITLTLQKPINTKMISKVVGWTDETMLKRYEHLISKQIVDVFQKVEKERENEKKERQHTTQNDDTKQPSYLDLYEQFETWTN